MAAEQKADRWLNKNVRVKKQSMAYKFKVVFEYFVSLAVLGPDILPLRGAADRDFGSALRHLRSHLDGTRRAIAGTMWDPNLRDKLERYPIWVVS